MCPCRAPAAAVPVGRCGAQPPPLGAAELPPVRPQPGNLGAGTGRPGGKQRGDGRTARLSPGQNACWDCRWLKIVNSRASIKDGVGGCLCTGASRILKINARVF